MNICFWMRKCLDKSLFIVPPCFVVWLPATQRNVTQRGRYLSQEKNSLVNNHRRQNRPLLTTCAPFFAVCPHSLLQNGVSTAVVNNRRHLFIPVLRQKNRGEFLAVKKCRVSTRLATFTIRRTSFFSTGLFRFFSHLSPLMFQVLGIFPIHASRFPRLSSPLSAFSFFLSASSLPLVSPASIPTMLPGNLAYQESKGIKRVREQDRDKECFDECSGKTVGFCLTSGKIPIE